MSAEQYRKTRTRTHVSQQLKHRYRAWTSSVPGQRLTPSSSLAQTSSRRLPADLSKSREGLHVKSQARVLSDSDRHPCPGALCALKAQVLVGDVVSSKVSAARVLYLALERPNCRGSSSPILVLVALMEGHSLVEVEPGQPILTFLLVCST